LDDGTLILRISKIKTQRLSKADQLIRCSNIVRSSIREIHTS